MKKTVPFRGDGIVHDGKEDSADPTSNHADPRLGFERYRVALGH